MSEETKNNIELLIQVQILVFFFPAIYPPRANDNQSAFHRLTGMRDYVFYNLISEYNENTRLQLVMNINDFCLDLCKEAGVSVEELRESY